ncbi:MAG: hypothetical protein JNK02_16425 [Planctomycetes bacterium]|nr:hypothetical protein [Planctomycetota bacterium]
MKPGTAATLALGLALLLVALWSSRLLRSAGAGGPEWGRAHPGRVEPELASRLARGELELAVQWFAPAPGSAPSGWDGVETRVAAAFAALERAAPLRVRAQVLRPEVDAEALLHAQALGLAPFRARRVVQDGWVDEPVWSALRVVVVGRGASVVRALTPDLAGSVQDLVAAAVREIETPRRARIALSAPPGHARLRALLRELGDLRDIDFDADADLAGDEDLLWWVVGAAPDERHARRIADFVERGGSVLVAASRFGARIEDDDLVLDEAGPDASRLFAELGAPADAAPLLEAPTTDAAGGAGSWTWHVSRSIGARQDFRALGAQPNGTLAFHAASALRPDLARLSETGATFTTLATSSERAFTLPGTARRAPLAALASGALGTAEPPRTLLALLAPDDPTHGSVVLSASASPFGDRALVEAHYAHAELVRVLAQGLASGERRVLAAVARARPARLAEAGAAERWTARLVCIALVPLGLVILGLARGAFGAARVAARPLAFLGAALALTALCGAAASALGPRPGFDPSLRGTRALPPELLAIATDTARDVPVAAAFHSSPSSSLPADLRPLARELADRLAALGRAVDGFGFREAAADDAEAARLGLRRLVRTSALDESRASTAFYASLVLERGGARRVLEFPDAAAFRHADFRVALALRDLERGARARVAFASSPARLTPAEAREHYQRRGLFAPGTGDPFGAARAFLLANGFDVVSVDPALPAAERPVDADLFVWLQPRRDASVGLERLARHLAAGRPALVAAQQHRIRPRLRADRPGEATTWPEPLFPDVDRLWFPDLGLRLDTELVLDAESAVLRTVGTREAEVGVESVSMDLANALVVRSTPAGRPRSALTAGVGDLVLPSPARFVLDAQALARAGLVAQVVLATSPRSWTATWRGGDVPAAAFVPPAEPPGPLPLGVLVEGAFPDSPAGGSPNPGAPRARLLLLGASEPFTDAHLDAEGYDHARFLLQACAALALEPEFAALAARRPSVGGYRVLDATERVVARAATLAAGPALVLVLAFLWRLGRARATVRAAAGGAA